MPKRICDACGKEKDVSGGKVCSNGHSIFSSCVMPSKDSNNIHSDRVYEQRVNTRGVMTKEAEMGKEG